MEMEPGGRALRSTLVALAVVGLGLLATGLFLTFEYRPHVRGVDDHVVSVMRTSHRLLAVAFAVLAAAVLIEAIAGSIRGRRLRGTLLAVCIVIFVAVAFITGRALPWDQLALRAVTIGSNVRGYGSILSGAVRYVLVGPREVSNATIARVFWLHVLVAPIGLVALGLASFLVSRRRGEVPAVPAESPDAPPVPVIDVS